jgi:MYXO-CTERM domain-containing protein
MCPADVNRCVDAPVPDAGPVDAGSSGSPDGGVVPIATEGCGCRARTPSSGPGALGLAALALVLVRRRQAGRSSQRPTSSAVAASK